MCVPPPSTGGASSIQLILKGAELDLSAPFSSTQLFGQQPNLQVQLVSSDGACWEATFAEPAKRQSAAQFVDRLPYRRRQTSHSRLPRSDAAAFLRKVADEHDTDVERIVNDWIPRDIDLLKSVS